MTQTRKCTVVGAGVSGLTTGIRLREAGWDAHIVAREVAHDTVSVVAAAVWTAIEVEPIDRCRRWALRSREVFARLSAETRAGVVPLRQVELERHDPGRSWWEDTPWVRRIPASDLPSGYGAGWEIDGFLIEPPIYLDWLLARFDDLGGGISEKAVESLEVLDDVVINCSGLGAKELASDALVHPIRGQVVAVVNPGVHDAIADESDPDRIAYVYPRSREIILGGLRQAGSTDPDPDDATTLRIIEDCGLLDARTEGLEVLDVRVGLRPGRSEVRVERESTASGTTVVHNYGHAGAGFILSWGCAEDVVHLLGRDSS